jgi:hypothetical protein
MLSHRCKTLAVFLGWAAVVFSSPSVSPRASTSGNSPAFLTNVTAVNATVPQYSKEQRHSNVLKHWPADRIITSAQLAELYEDPASQPKLLNTTSMSATGATGPWFTPRATKRSLDAL